ncbi:MAG: hypothetical protein CVU21_16820 [Betaproteobacteria bacterium HGW-Betaproteobacteria-15]|nr:MAG: hypothetical protein CVU21_16820 [Betaproteobacteria bacterium HGW-Betaproteobacteria-15]
MSFQRFAKPALAIASTMLLLSACGGGDGLIDTRGSIAVSNTTGKAAIVYGAGNQNIANDLARDKCGGGDCTVVLQFGQCGAISSDSNVGVYAVAEGASPASAQQAADNGCVAKGGQTCAAPADLHARCN